MFDLLQKHTVDLYKLKEHSYEKQIVAAKSLLSAQRFDLFAKLFYIANREKNKALALQVYGDHIKAFNPDFKEPGRNDKNSLNDFVTAFDGLIDYFKNNEFDETVSMIPVSTSGDILDGSHRVAALAFYNKKITILKFKQVQFVSQFDYAYFQKRGLSSFVADKVALEALKYTDNMYTACLWPKMGKIKNRTYAMDIFNQHSKVLYIKDVSMSLKGLSDFMLYVYKNQNWVGTKDDNYAGVHDKALNCSNINNKIVRFVLFQSSSLELVQQTKEDIRTYYGLGKHVVHITDDKYETEDIANIIFTEASNKFSNGLNKLSDNFSEYKVFFKNVYILKVKIGIARYLSKIGLYKK